MGIPEEDRVRHLHAVVLQGAVPNGGKTMAQFEYGKVSSSDEIKAELLRLGFASVSTTYVTLLDYEEVIAKMAEGLPNVVCFNLCDGTEDDGYPGLGVIQALDRFGIRHTGSDAAFYVNTTRKSTMKDLFHQHNVPASQYVQVRLPATHESIEADVEKAMQKVRPPLFVKCDAGYCSLSIGVRSVARDATAAVNRIKELEADAEVDTPTRGIIIEKYLPGREFTTLVVGTQGRGSGVQCMAVVERLFLRPDGMMTHASVWEGYDPVTGHEPSYKDMPFSYHLVEDQILLEKLRTISCDAYNAVGGTGYGRLDIRLDEDGNPFVLEVNSQPGVSVDPGESSIGQMFQLGAADKTQFFRRVVEQVL